MLQKQDRNQCCPNLNLERVGRGSHKRLDPQVLFQDLKKNLYLPSVFIGRGDRCRSEFQMIRQKHNLLPLLSVENLDPS
jgi:hypothetical protein